MYVVASESACRFSVGGSSTDGHCLVFGRTSADS